METKEGGSSGESRGGKQSQENWEGCHILSTIQKQQEHLCEARNALLDLHLILKFRKTSFTKNELRKVSRQMLHKSIIRKKEPRIWIASLKWRKHARKMPTIWNKILIYYFKMSWKDIKKMIEGLKNKSKSEKIRNEVTKLTQIKNKRKKAFRNEK